MKKPLIILALLLAITGCETRSGQNRYDYTEVGKSRTVEFGRVVQVREVDVTGENSGVGAIMGGTAGGVAGNQIGGGNGSVVGLVGGAVAGAVIGAATEQASQNSKALEYLITKENGKTITIVQPHEKNERLFKVGDRVMVQISGSYQRVMPVDNVPSEIKRAKGIKLVD